MFFFKGIGVELFKTSKKPNKLPVNKDLTWCHRHIIQVILVKWLNIVALSA